MILRNWNWIGALVVAAVAGQGLLVVGMAGCASGSANNGSPVPASETDAAAPVKPSSSPSEFPSDPNSRASADKEVQARDGTDSGPPGFSTAPVPSNPGQKEAGGDPPIQQSASEPQNPFPRQVAIPEFPSELQWLNVDKPLRKADLNGKFVLLDFWTYCCINCMHILPELKKLEQAYPNQLVVIGVHSAKFETEKGSKNIEEAILRYEIEHPVINDADHKIWDTFGVRSWPTVFLVDPAGNAVWGRSGEFQADEIRELLEAALPFYRAQKLLDEKPLQLALLSARQKDTPLRFPGKVRADEMGQRLFIADSNHNRIVVATLDGKCLAIIGSGARGRDDGGFESATFDHPQGMALAGETLYVADTENHLLRKIDLSAKRVETIAGTGVQGRHPWPGLDKLTPGSQLPDRWVGEPLETAISSPWDLWIHRQDLYIAMAGAHQIWKMPLDESEIGPYAGNGREDIVDGPLLPMEPYGLGFASFAQPSGLAGDDRWLYVADSEGSSIRAVPFDSAKQVRTVVGTADLPINRLFHFGDRDGPREEVLLQHCLGVGYYQGQLYVADSYNNKIKTINPETGETRTLAGAGKAGHVDAKGELDEPAGITVAQGRIYVADTNNHQIRVIEPATGKISTLQFEGLSPPSTR